MATLDTVESFHPRLPGEEGSEIELSLTEGRGGRNLPLSEFEIIMQRLEQMKQGK